MNFQYTTSPSMLSVRPLAEEPPSGAIPGHAATETAPQDTGAAYDLRADLDEILRSVSQEDRSGLELELDELQERSLDILYRTLAEAGFSLRERLVIAVDADGRLHVNGHPQAQAISLILVDNPHLADNLRTMAAMSLALRGANDLALARSLLHGERTGSQLLFQACLKGGLSHFHLLDRPQ